MANIRVDLNHIIQDGMDLVFNAPCHCSQITGLIVYYPSSNNTMSKQFTFRDAHRNDIGNLDNLFADGARIKVNLDVTNGYAYIQNADTNAYLEGRFDEIITGGVVVQSAQTAVHADGARIATSVNPISGGELKFFVGTQAEYNALSEDVKNDGLLAAVTDGDIVANYADRAGWATYTSFSKSDAGAWQAFNVNNVRFEHGYTYQVKFYWMETTGSGGDAGQWVQFIFSTSQMPSITDIGYRIALPRIFEIDNNTSASFVQCWLKRESTTEYSFHGKMWRGGSESNIAGHTSFANFYYRRIY